MPTIIGHRGAAGLAPENTLRSFRTALEHGVDAVEFDVRRSADGELVVVHDSTVDRTTDGSGAVSDMTLAELRALDAGDGERIPTVSAVLELLAPTDARLQIELKERDVGGDVLDELDSFGLRDRAVLTSFDEEALRAVQSTPVERAFLTSSFGPDAVERAGTLDAAYVCTGVDNASRSAVERAHDAGLAIGFWGVDAVPQIETVLDVGGDVLSTDRPDRVAELVA